MGKYTGAVTLEVRGEKYDVKIGNIRAYVADPHSLWRKEDVICIFLEFDQDNHPVNLLCFEVVLPAREYERTKFLKLLKLEAEEGLRNLVAQYDKEREQGKTQAERLQNLNNLVDHLKESLRHEG